MQICGFADLQFWHSANANLQIFLFRKSANFSFVRKFADLRFADLICGMPTSATRTLEIWVKSVTYFVKENVWQYALAAKKSVLRKTKINVLEYAQANESPEVQSAFIIVDQPRLIFTKDSAKLSTVLPPY